MNSPSKHIQALARVCSGMAQLSLRPILGLPANDLTKKAMESHWLVSDDREGGQPK